MTLLREWMRNRRKNRDTEILDPGTAETEIPDEASRASAETKGEEAGESGSAGQTELQETGSDNTDSREKGHIEHIEMEESGTVFYDGRKRPRARSVVLAVSCVLGFLLCMAGGIVCALSMALDTVGSLGMSYPYSGKKPTAAEALAAKHLMQSPLTDLENKMFTFMLVLFVCALICAISGIITCGKRRPEGGVYLRAFDRVWGDVQILAGILSGLVIVPIASILSDPGMQDEIWTFITYVNRIKLHLNSQDMSMIHKWMSQGDFHSTFGFTISGPFALVLVLMMAAGVILFEEAVILSIARKLKSRCFWKYTLIGTVCRGIYHGVDRFFSSRKKITRTVMLAVLPGVFLAGMVDIMTESLMGMVIFGVLICIFLPGRLKHFEDLQRGVREIRNGNVDYKIPNLGTGALGQMAEDINSIADAQDAAVQNLMKNERMKTALISNVSHDLKTPLTSIVTYVDLLKTEGLDSPNAPEYLAVLDQKTRRLQRLTLNLFDAAKASSGDIPVHLAELDFYSLVNQAYAEMEDDLKARDLTFILQSHAGTAVRITADGQLLWRVIENILTNIKKYAMPHTRIYADIYEEQDDYCLTVKNISESQLNISADELMKRFTRGDDSRSTEGSGLGLAIAQDLARVMHGGFQISIDGDLFTAAVRMPKA